MGKFNVKTTDRKTIEVEGKLVKSPQSPQPPEWFKSFEQKIENRFDNLENRFDNLVAKNNLKE